uniref:NADH dehydrogenase subunit 2 n=1 Tax=Cellana orientalis TaxID=351212 RepID=UPI002028AE4D|nr:NADH dehydrogenase subunit 2 [Cellana orientalis]UPX89397.1 NADH dehydrogenase subunit 2 [Cellana orientalis]
MFSFLPFVSFFIFLVMFGSIVSISSFHWLFVWVGLEVNLMGFIPVLVYSGGRLMAESGVKYFLIQALGSSLFAGGSCVVFGSLSSLDISYGWVNLSEMESMSMIGFFILFLSLLMKLGCFPFYSWVPSVSVGCSWFSCFFLLTWQKLAPFFVLFSVNGFYMGMMIWAVGVVGGLSSLVGGIGGMGETCIRSLLGYSSIGHSGWMVYSGILGFSTFFWYYCVYFVVSVCLFCILGILGSGGMGHFNSFFKDKSFIMGFSLMAVFLSLGGIPPMLGFFGKMIVIFNGVFLSNFVFIFLLILGSLMSLYYYLLLFFGVFFSNKSFLLESSFFLSSGSSSLGLYLVSFVLKVVVVLNLFGVIFCFLIL